MMAQPTTESLFSRIEPQPKITDLIAAQLRKRILDGDLMDGELLPPETQLAVEFGVARPTLREAFRILETEGLIAVIPGSRKGARVSAPKIETSARYAAMSLRAAGATLAETYAAQLALEPYAVRLLAERRCPEDIVELESRLEELEKFDSMVDSATRAVALARYHLLLVRLTENRALLVMAEILAKVLEVHQGSHRPPLDDFTQTLSELDFRSLGPKSIRRLVELIRDGDADAAEVHWRKHLQNAARFWLTGLNSDAIIDFGG